MTTKIGGNNYYENENNSTFGNSRSIDDTGTDNNSNVIPALGESWAHATTTRILLTFDGNNVNNNNEYGIPGERRICKLVKSSHRPAGIAYFAVTEFGLRDCVQ